MDEYTRTLHKARSAQMPGVYIEMGEGEAPAPLTRRAFGYRCPDRFAAGEDTPVPAQQRKCSACYLFTGEVCSILGPDVKVQGGWSCDLYVPGAPHDQEAVASVAPPAVGLKRERSNCGSCGCYDSESKEAGTCKLFAKLSSCGGPGMYALDTQVDVDGGCAAWSGGESEEEE